MARLTSLSPWSADHKPQAPPGPGFSDRLGPWLRQRESRLAAHGLLMVLTLVGGMVSTALAAPRIGELAAVTASPLASMPAELSQDQLQEEGVTQWLEALEREEQELLLLRQERRSETAEVATGTGGVEGVPGQAIFTYVVKPGDTLSSLASRFGISTDTIVWSNDSLEGNPHYLKVGQELTILPFSGVAYTVRPGDTLETIANRHKVSQKAILGYAGNNISDPSRLSVGQKLVIPGGQKPPAVVYIPAPTPIPAKKAPATPPAAPPKPAPGKPFIWPASGIITQYFWARHLGIDIAKGLNHPIVAAGDGTVVYVGPKDGGYGNIVIIDHGNGYQTWYSHLNAWEVKVGQVVKRGQLIGKMGATGRSTGPHLDFRVFLNGRALNPLSVLP
ncbi:MAG: M23 family metallopeptidase [Chloroflexi bacterium]|nr:M23 family metallopeptidase [Chloroflexota bacterium]